MPPCATGRMPETSLVRTTCAKETVVPSVLRTRFATPPVVQAGTPEEFVTRAAVFAVVIEASVSAEEV